LAILCIYIKVDNLKISVLNSVNSKVTDNPNLEWTVCYCILLVLNFDHFIETIKLKYFGEKKCTCERPYTNIKTVEIYISYVKRVMYLKVAEQ